MTILSPLRLPVPPPPHDACNAHATTSSAHRRKTYIIPSPDFGRRNWKAAQEIEFVPLLMTPFETRVDIPTPQGHNEVSVHGTWVMQLMKGGLMLMKPSSIHRVIAGALLVAAAGGTLAVRLLAARHAKTKVLGLNKVIAFTYSPAKDFDPKQLHSVTFVGPVNAADWKYWQSRGVVAGVGHTWFDLLRSPLDKAVDNLTGQDYGGNPQPVVMIDEFGFDYGGQMDQKSAQILRQAKLKKPDLALAVWQMRGPIPQVLAEAYRDAADLVMLESYVGNQQQYWWIATQVWSARRYGILPKTIVVLGVGKGGNPGENWAETKEELEQQIRFVRLIAPESPGVGFFGGTPELLASCRRLVRPFLPFSDRRFGAARRGPRSRQDFFPPL